MRDAIILPARSSEIADRERLLVEASDRLPLAQLECHVDVFGVAGDALGYLYVAPAGKEIHALVQSSDPEVGTTVFVARALTYGVHNLRTGTSAHGTPLPYEPDIAGHVYHRANWAREERRRPVIGVTLFGELEPRAVIEGEDRVLEIGGQRVYCFPERIGTDVQSQSVHSDIERMELSVRDQTTQTAHDDIEIPDFGIWADLRAQLWRPFESLSSPLSAQDMVDDAVAAHPELADDLDMLDRLRRHLFEQGRRRGHPMKDDPYPEAQDLQLASVVDAHGNNARLYSPYEDLGRYEDYVAELLLPDGSTRRVATMSEQEYWRRDYLNTQVFQPTGWSDWRRHAQRSVRRVRHQREQGSL